MGVLKVNVGDAVTPDWRKIGCGGSPMAAYPTAANTVAVYDPGDGTLVALANQLTQTGTTILDIDLSAATFYFTFDSGSVSGQSRFVSSNTNGGAQVRGAGDSVGYPAFGNAIFCRDGAYNYLGNASRANATVLAATPPGRLKLWTGTEWVREACDDDPVPEYPTAANTATVYYDSATGKVLAYANAIDPLTEKIEYNTSTTLQYLLLESGTPSGQSIWSLGGFSNQVGVTLNPLYARRAGGTYLATITSTSTTVVALPPSARPLKLWDGSSWVTVACMVPA